MELVGEKKIQALFSELRLADEQIMPSFAGVWNRAQAKTLRPQRAFNLSFVAATALLVCALVSLALWSARWQPRQDAVVSNPPIPTASPAQVAPGTVAPATKDPEPKRWEQPRANPGSRGLKLAARRQALLAAANRRAMAEAKALASWQSPTATLLDSPSDELLKSLPQLNHTVDELKLFLLSSPN